MPAERTHRTTGQNPGRIHRDPTVSIHGDACGKKSATARYLGDRGRAGAIEYGKVHEHGIRAHAGHSNGKHVCTDHPFRTTCRMHDGSRIGKEQPSHALPRSTLGIQPNHVDLECIVHAHTTATGFSCLGDGDINGAIHRKMPGTATRVNECVRRPFSADGELRIGVDTPGTNEWDEIINKMIETLPCMTSKLGL